MHAKIMTIFGKSDSLNFGDADAKGRGNCWHTVIDREDTYIEMSATAAFAYSVMRAVHTGFLDKGYAEAAKRADSAVKADINGRGEVMHGSMGICVMED